MEIKTYKFNTNLNCGGCVSRVQHDLDNTKEIEKWEVDTNSTEKTLTVLAHDITEENIMNIIRNKGFTIEPA